MNTDMIWRITTSDPEATEAFGRKLGSRLRGGEVIELTSDLGGGKTTFVRGLASGAGSENAVGSPSFTISREYETPGFTIHHYDFYRLAEPGLMSQELAEVLADPKMAVVVEWADVVDNVLPEERVRIHIEAVGETDRTFAIELPKKFDYLRSDA